MYFSAFSRVLICFLARFKELLGDSLLLAKGLADEELLAFAGLLAKGLADEELLAFARRLVGETLLLLLFESFLVASLIRAHRIGFVILLGSAILRRIAMSTSPTLVYLVHCLDPIFKPVFVE